MNQNKNRSRECENLRYWNENGIAIANQPDRPLPPFWVAFPKQAFYWSVYAKPVAQLNLETNVGSLQIVTEKNGEPSRKQKPYIRRSHRIFQCNIQREECIFWDYFEDIVHEHLMQAHPEMLYSCFNKDCNEQFDKE